MPYRSYLGFEFQRDLMKSDNLMPHFTSIYRRFCENATNAVNNTSLQNDKNEFMLQSSKMVGTLLVEAKFTAEQPQNDFPCKCTCS